MHDILAEIFMIFLTSIHGRNLSSSFAIIFCFAFVCVNLLQAQTRATPAFPSLTATNYDGALAPADLAETNAPTATPTPASAEATPTPTPVAPAANPTILKSVDSTLHHEASAAPLPAWLIVAPLLTLLSLGGFMLYQCGLTRAKNCGHTSTLLLVGVMFALIGYWIGGFAVQTGGAGDSHAALTGPLLSTEKGTLDHELGFMAAGHHWGIMGSSGFFLMTDPAARNGIMAIFLGQAALLVIAVAAALGAALERGRILAMAVGAFLIGVFIYPLLANWVWGGGWLAEMGREYGLGHGFIDLGGASVVHETAGTLALVIAVILGPRHGRFGRQKSSGALPGHNMPFLILGTLLLLVSWSATNAFAGDAANAGLAAANTLLASAGGLLISFFLASSRKGRPEPAVLCRGLLGGAVASCGCSGLIDPWAAFVIGALAGLFVQGTMAWLERSRIDDPSGAVAVHGACGAWGALATGLFANGIAGQTALNGVDGPVRGLFFGGAGPQLAAQGIGCVADFVVVFILGYAFFMLIQKILGMRVDAAEEVEGLDWTETGALGYQGDISPDEK